MQFDDGKAPDALRTIGEVAKVLGIRQHVLRYWEDQFPMLRPVKRSGGRRYYRSEDIELVATIDRLVHREGYTLKGARKALTDGAKAPAPVPQPSAPRRRPRRRMSCRNCARSGNGSPPRSTRPDGQVRRTLCMNQTPSALSLSKGCLFLRASRATA